MAPSEAKRCSATKTDGTPCRAYAAAGEEYCNAHLGRIGGDTSQHRKAAKPNTGSVVAPGDFDALAVLEGIAADPKTPHSSRVMAARAAADLRRQDTPGPTSMDDAQIERLVRFAIRRIPREYPDLFLELLTEMGYELVKVPEPDATPPPLS